MIVLPDIFHICFFNYYSPNRAKHGTYKYIGKLVRSRRVSYPLFLCTLEPNCPRTFYDVRRDS